MVSNRSKLVAFTYEQILQDKYERHQAEVAEANAELERARLQEDDYSTRAAADRLNQLNLERRSMDEIANNYVASQQPQAPAGADGLSRRDVDLARRFGLSANEIGIAKGWTSDANLTDEAKVKEYVQQRQRYQQARRDGSYRDDQAGRSR
jgi:hypothetical protein